MKPVLSAFVLLIAGWPVAAFGADPGALTPVDLRCEYAIDPLGIDVPARRLFWRVESAERGQRQFAWQVLVASAAETPAQDRGDLWDSVDRPGVTAKDLNTGPRSNTHFPEAQLHQDFLNLPG